MEVVVIKLSYPFPENINPSDRIVNIDSLLECHMSSGIRFLVNYGRKYNKKFNHKPKLIGLTSKFKEVLEITGFKYLLKYYDYDN